MVKKLSWLLSLLLILGCVQLSGAQAVNSERNEIAVISDIHLGADDRFAEINENKDELLAFLKTIRSSPSIAELVMLGDVVDQWFLPMDYEVPLTLAQYNDLVVSNNRAIFDEIKGIIKDGSIKVTYVPGNHDINLTAEETQRIFPGITQTRDTHGLGTYSDQAGSIRMEHGHRYNFFCAPDTLSNRNMTGGEPSILPCGYFFTRIAASSVMQKKPQTANTFPDITPDTQNAVQMGYYYYYMDWKTVLEMLPVKESFDEPTIKTNMDGYQGVYAIRDLIPSQDDSGLIGVKMYEGIVENWQERQALNLVGVPIPAKDAILGALPAAYTDSQANRQYFDADSAVKLVVFGHTHEAKIIKSTNSLGQDVLYANSGTWIDHQANHPVRTYLVIKPTDKEIKVALYQFSGGGTSVKLAEESIKK